MLKLGKENLDTQLAYQIWQDIIGHIVGHLTGTSCEMSTPTVLEHDFADIDSACTVQNGFANGKNGILLFKPPQNMHGDLALGVQGINHEAIGTPDGVFLPQI